MANDITQNISNYYSEIKHYDDQSLLELINDLVNTTAIFIETKCIEDSVITSQDMTMLRTVPVVKSKLQKVWVKDSRSLSLLNPMSLFNKRNNLINECIKGAKLKKMEIIRIINGNQKSFHSELRIIKLIAKEVIKDSEFHPMAIVAELVLMNRSGIIKYID